MYNIYIYKLYNLFISIRNIYLCTDCCVRGIYFRGIEYPRIQNQNFDHLRVTLFDSTFFTFQISEFINLNSHR